MGTGDLIQGDSDRGDIPESDTQPGRRRVRVPRICGSSYGGWISQRVFGVVRKERERREAKKPLGAMNDIIEFHAALIPVFARTTRPRAPTKISSSETEILRYLEV